MAEEVKKAEEAKVEKAGEKRNWRLGSPQCHRCGARRQTPQFGC